MKFSRTYEVRWADLDPNFHVRHTAYADYAAQARMAYLTERGFPLERFRELSLGPVLFTENIRYLKEVKAGDVLNVGVEITETSPDGRKFTIRHEIHRGDGQLAAEIVITGAWLDTKARKIVVPPQELLEAFRS